MQIHAGFKVAVISRDNSKLEKLKGFVSPGTKNNLTTIVGNVGKRLLPMFHSDFCQVTTRMICYWWISPGSEDAVEDVKQALLRSVGKITDVVSSLGFSWWQGGPPHTQPLKELQWVSISGDRWRSHTLQQKQFFCVPIKSKQFCTYKQIIETLLYSTFVSWKAFFPLVRDNPNGTYTFITGGSLVRHTIFKYCLLQMTEKIVLQEVLERNC